jgi:hypothetical protein
MPMAEAKTTASSVAREHVAKAVSQIEGLLRPSETSISSSLTKSTTSLTSATSRDSLSLTSDSTTLNSTLLQSGPISVYSGPSISPRLSGPTEESTSQALRK